jgi:hypothetical protein
LPHLRTILAPERGADAPGPLNGTGQHDHAQSHRQHEWILQALFKRRSIAMP